jgi:hypothetical protein
VSVQDGNRAEGNSKSEECIEQGPLWAVGMLGINQNVNKLIHAEMELALLGTKANSQNNVHSFRFIGAVSTLRNRHQ